MLRKFEYTFLLSKVYIAQHQNFQKNIDAHVYLKTFFHVD